MPQKNYYYWEVALNLDDLDFDDLIRFDKAKVSENQRLLGISQTEALEKMKTVIQFRRDKLYRKCSNCGKPCAKKCGGCKGPYYCSEECQLSEWSDHKPCCKPRFEDFSDFEGIDPCD